MSITGFKSGAVKLFAEKQDARKLPRQHLKRISRILTLLDDDEPLHALRTAGGYRLHELKGKRKGEWSVRVSGNMRITFRIDKDGNAYDIDWLDYH